MTNFGAVGRTDSEFAESARIGGTTNTDSGSTLANIAIIESVSSTTSVGGSAASVGLIARHCCEVGVGRRNGS